MFSISADLFYNDVENEDEDNNNIIQLLRIRRNIRDNSNILELPDRILNKNAFTFLLRKINNKFTPATRISSIPPIIKLASALRFFADGSYQKSTGNDFNLGLAQPTVSLILTEVLKILENHICDDWIKIQMSEEEKEEAKMYFFQKSGFPGVIGCVDGTHVAILTPSSDVRHHFLNRKGFSSLNVLIACDHKERIRCVDPRFPGASHDSFIFKQSVLKEVLEKNYRNGELNTWYVGDSGYPLLPYLITPFRGTAAGSREANFNKVLSKTRNINERTIGILKSRFRCLLQHRTLNYSPAKAKKIINVCSALHNICKHFNVSDPDIETESEIFDEIAEEENQLEIEDNSDEAKRIRNRILASLTFRS